MTTPAGPARYGSGLAVLLVGTGAEPFPPDLHPLPDASVVLVDSGAPGGPPPGAEVLSIGEDVGRGAAVNRAVAVLPADVGLVAD